MVEVPVVELAVNEVTVRVEVATMAATFKSPAIKALPCIDRRRAGEEVAIPRLPLASNLMRSDPAVERARVLAKGDHKPVSGSLVNV